MDVEYISLHGYIQNTPSDTEVHAEHQLRADRSTWPVENNIQSHSKLCKTKELWEKQECQQDCTWSWRVGELKQQNVPILGQLSESEEKHLSLRVKQLICGNLNRMRIIQSLLQPYILQRGTLVHWRHSSWELEFRDCGAIPGRGLLFIAEKRTEGM